MAAARVEELAELAMAISNGDAPRKAMKEVISCPGALTEAQLRGLPVDDLLVQLETIADIIDEKLVQDDLVLEDDSFYGDDAPGSRRQRRRRRSDDDLDSADDEQCLLDEEAYGPLPPRTPPRHVRFPTGDAAVITDRRTYLFPRTIAGFLLILLAVALFSIADDPGPFCH